MTKPEITVDELAAVLDDAIGDWIIANGMQQENAIWHGKSRTDLYSNYLYLRFENGPGFKITVTRF